jgi:hypothetical protein
VGPWVVVVGGGAWLRVVARVESKAAALFFVSIVVRSYGGTAAHVCSCVEGGQQGGGCKPALRDSAKSGASHGDAPWLLTCRP